MLDSLRQPLENGDVVISRANRHVRYPARFQLVAAMNPCRCGGGDGGCRRGPRCAQSYQARLSGPFLDRIDLFYDTPPVTAVDLTLPPPAEGTREVAGRVAAARMCQRERFEARGDTSRRPVNADASGQELERVIGLDDAGHALLADAAAKLSLSARAYYRVQKVARTIADLEGAGGVKRVHLAEALSYRRRDPAQAEGVSSGALAR